MRWVRAFLCVSAARSNAEAREDDVIHDRFDEIAKSRPSLPNSRDDFGRVQRFFLGIFDEFFFFLRLPNAAARVEPFASNRALHQPPVHNPGHKPSQPTRTDLLYPYKPYPTPTQTLNTTASRSSRTTKARARRLRTSRSPIPSASSGTPLRTKPR